MIKTLVPGALVSFLYPAANFCGIRPRLERRRVLIQRLRDLENEPLDPLTMMLDPQLRRGRWLATGIDLEKRAERSFYVESMDELAVQSVRGSFCVAELEPAIHVQRIVASELSFVAAAAHVVCCEKQDSDSDFVVLPMQ